MTTTTLRPTTELVLKKWLTSVVGVTSAGAVLPADASTWATDGFVQYAVIGGTSDPYSNLRKPWVQLDFWAVSPSSNKAPWNQANALAEQVRAATYVTSTFEVSLALGNGYGPARVLSAYFTDEPRRMSDQTDDAARYMAQMVFVWVAS